MRLFAPNLCQFLNRTTLCAHSDPSDFSQISISDLPPTQSCSHRLMARRHNRSWFWHPNRFVLRLSSSKIVNGAEDSPSILNSPRASGGVPKDSPGCVIFRNRVVSTTRNDSIFSVICVAHPTFSTIWKSSSVRPVTGRPCALVATTSTTTNRFDASPVIAPALAEAWPGGTLLSWARTGGTAPKASSNDRKQIATQRDLYESGRVRRGQKLMREPVLHGVK
jgi:hypothetical protein